MTVEKKSVDPAAPFASPSPAPASESGTGCFGLSMLLLGCIGAAVLLCVLFGRWK